MTEELFREDAYLKSCEATVTAVGDAGVVLDRTVFYPTGGGQPRDSGILIRAGGPTVAIADTRKAAGGIAHVLADGAAAPPVGEKVTVTLALAPRSHNTRVHTAPALQCRHVVRRATARHNRTGPAPPHLALTPA